MTSSPSARSTATLTFEQYRLYLASEVFSSLPDKQLLEERRALEKRIDEVYSFYYFYINSYSCFYFCSYSFLLQVCWLICCPPYLERRQPVFSQNCVQYLWRVFCMLGEVSHLILLLTLLYAKAVAFVCNGWVNQIHIF